MTEREPIVALLGDERDCTAVARLMTIGDGKSKHVHLMLQQAPADGPPQVIRLNLEFSNLLDLGMYIAYLCKESTAPVAKPGAVQVKPRRGSTKGATA